MSAIDPASEPEPDWRAKLDVALDAMKARRNDISEPIFDELDAEHPGWQFDVPMRGKVDPTHSVEKAARCLITTMLFWAMGEHRRPDGWSKRKLSKMMKQSDHTTDTDIMRGERQMLNPTTNMKWPVPTEYEQRYRFDRHRHSVTPMWWPAELRYSGLASVGFLEEDFEPEEIRRARRRKALTRAVYNGDS